MMHKNHPGARIHPDLGLPHRSMSHSYITVRTGVPPTALAGISGGRSLLVFTCSASRHLPAARGGAGGADHAAMLAHGLGAVRARLAAEPAVHRHAEVRKVPR